MGGESAAEKRKQPSVGTADRVSSRVNSRMARIYIHVTIRRLRGSLRKLNFILPGSIRAKIQMEAARGGRRPGRLHVAQICVPLDRDAQRDVPHIGVCKGK